MIARGMRSQGSNPFASRHLQPGAIPFLFRDEQSIEGLADQISKARCLRQAIVGPHGTGKSTLIQQLCERLGCPAIVLHSTTPKQVGLMECMARVRSGDLCLIDGYEQLTYWGRGLLVAYAARRRVKLCASSHRLPLGFELIWETKVDHAVEDHVISRLLVGAEPQVKSALLESEAWRKSREKQGENLRESLFDMYDWWRDTVDELSPRR